MSESGPLTADEVETLEQLSKRDDLKSQQWAIRLLNAADRVKSESSDDSGSKPGYVYIIEAGDGVMKIGYSSKPEQRLRALQSANPTELSLVKRVWFRDGMGVEKRLHEEYAEYRKSGEWFEFDREMREEFLERLEELRGIDG